MSVASGVLLFVIWPNMEKKTMRLYLLNTRQFCAQQQENYPLWANVYQTKSYGIHTFPKTQLRNLIFSSVERNSTIIPKSLNATEQQPKKRQYG